MIIKNRHSLSLIMKMLNRLYDVKIFTKLNLKDIYHKIRIKKNDEWKIAFRTRYDHFEYLIMFFKLINALIIFQTYINKILIDLMNVIYIIYLNDILIYNVDASKH